jgi:antitoxin component of MazEF toxin-antitoxin module
MRTKLVKIGNDLAFEIPNEVLEKMGIGLHTELEISVEGTNLIITPVGEDDHRKKVKDALEKTDKQYDKALRRLAE